MTAEDAGRLLRAGRRGEEPGPGGNGAGAGGTPDRPRPMSLRISATMSRAPASAATSAQISGTSEPCVTRRGEEESPRQARRYPGPVRMAP